MQHGTSHLARWARVLEYIFLFLCFYFVVEKVSMPGSGGWGCKWLMFFLYWEAALTIACSYFMDSGVIGLSFLHHFSKMRLGIITKQRSRLGWVWATDLFLTFSMSPALIFSGVTFSSVLSRKLIWFLSSNWPVPRMSTKWLIPSILSFFWRENCLFLESLALTSVGKKPKANIVSM